ncbi:MAG: DUF502 domain-containing protein [Chlamydiae bacterium]|nr:DUF502 domain-containing protein [Chlamydiota bacterium]MBI3277363.1 DUF502 domain-containing protein [Chlamydiota bacterium]
MFLKKDRSYSFNKKIRVYFFTGLLVSLPVLGSFWILSVLFVKLTDFMYQFIAPNGHQFFGQWLLWRLVALILLFCAVVLIGLVARNYIGKKLIQGGETLLSKIPVLNRIYSTLKQIFESFWGEDKAVFRSVVFVEYPREGTYSIGFVTSEIKGDLKDAIGENKVSVFIPTAPNPTSGFLIMISKDKLIKTHLTVEDGFKMVVSSGMVMPK